MPMARGKIRTPIARSRPGFAKCRVLQALEDSAFGFDSHRPPHFQPSLANASQLDLQLTSGGTLVAFHKFHDCTRRITMVM
jgi:hypothetical protein